MGPGQANCTNHDAGQILCNMEVKLEECQDSYEILAENI
jgi:hypothetical protein